MLSKAQRSELRNRIDAELERLAQESATLTIMTQPVSPDRAIGRLSRLEAMNEKSMNEAALRAATSLAHRLRGALSRIDGDDFGVCTNCDEDIPFARLLSMPDSRLCVACREQAES